MTRLIALAALLALALGVHAASSGKPQSTSITSLSDDANGCFADQTTAGAASLSLDGALATSNVCIFASAQQISIEGAADESGVVATIIGTDADGRISTEALTLANAGTAKSVLYYKTITSIAVDGALTGNIEGGPLSTNGAVSATLVPDLAGYKPLMSIVADITGTMTVTVQHTSFTMPSGREPVWFDTVDMTAVTADTEGNIGAPVGGVRLNITAYTSGSAELLILQAKR